MHKSFYGIKNPKFYLNNKTKTCWLLHQVSFNRQYIVASKPYRQKIIPRDSVNEDNKDLFTSNPHALTFFPSGLQAWTEDKA